MNGRAASRCSAVLLGAALFAGSLSASAQDVAAAEALFTEGRALMEKGDYAAACPKLAESQRLDPSSGTALNLARCHEKQGKTATAWAEYKVAVRLARQQGKLERAKEAGDLADELEKKLSHLTITVTSPVAGLEVRRDDVRLEQGSLGSSLPIDPGKHVVTASAPGCKPVTLEVTIGGAADAQTLTIPPLEKAEQGAATPAQAPGGPQPPSGGGETTPAPPGRGPAPWVVGGIGIASLAVGAALGGLALKTYSDAKSACPTMMHCAQSALDQRSTAGTYAKVADVTIPVGATAVVVATVLFFVLPRGTPEAKPPAAVALVPSVGSNGAGLSLAGAFQ
jgi:hypothetical protein